MEPPQAKKAKMPKVATKCQAEVQITAEQLLQEAAATKMEKGPPPPRQKITDPGELADLQLRKRKEFEDNVRKNRTVMTNWIKYARWEETQQQFEWARSVYERAIKVDYQNIPVWLKYAEMEIGISKSTMLVTSGTELFSSSSQSVLVQMHLHGGNAG